MLAVRRYGCASRRHLGPLATLPSRLLRVGALLALALGAALLPVCAAIVVVTPTGSLADALRRASDGDEIQIMAGEYHGQVGIIEQRHLTLRGVGGRPVLHADGQHAEGKAILVVRDGDVRIENIEFRGARVPDGNGAGIRFERGRLRVARCAFFDNQNGVLTANFGDAELVIEDSEFGQAPGDGRLPHLLYVGRIARLTVTGSRFSGGHDGHLIKSRARESRILYNQLVDGPGGRAAYELEFPNGGLATVVGNVIGQSPDSSNPAMLSFGAEGSDERPQGLYVGNNTFINEGLRPAYFVRVHEEKLQREVPRVLQNNLFVGLGVGDARWADVARGNFIAAPAMLQDVGAANFTLARGSWLRGLGVDPASAAGVDLQPVEEFTPPAGRRALAPRTKWSPGAYQE
jgi:hypothetical protein